MNTEINKLTKQLSRLTVRRSRVIEDLQLIDLEHTRIEALIKEKNSKFKFRKEENTEFEGATGIDRKGNLL